MCLPSHLRFSPESRILTGTCFSFFLEYHTVRLVLIIEFDLCGLHEKHKV